MESNKAGRRRGAVLENAILDAAWTELEQVGYFGLTMEAVATRSGTSRSVVNRRWPSRAALAAAAMARFVELHPILVPDRGAIRTELIELLHQISDRGVPVLVRLVLDMRDDLGTENSSPADLKERFVEDDLVDKILERGISRGEVDPSRVTTRIKTLPTDLVRHDAIMTLKTLSHDAILRIVDDIFLPLVANSPTRMS